MALTCALGAVAGLQNEQMNPHEAVSSRKLMWLAPVTVTARLGVFAPA